MLKYGTALAGLGALASAAALTAAPTSAATGMQLIDFAERLVAPAQIKAAGFDGALVYVSELRPGATFDFKPVTREFADGMRALGLHVVSCYQYGKPGWPNSPSDFTRGFDGGVADARTALRLHGAAREAAYFATAPFVGAAAAVPLLGDSLGLPELGAMGLMALGVVLMMRERHAHAWVEAYHGGAWHVWDPTPASAFSRKAPLWERALDAISDPRTLVVIVLVTALGAAFE